MIEANNEPTMLGKQGWPESSTLQLVITVTYNAESFDKEAATKALCMAAQDVMVADGVFDVEAWDAEVLDFDEE